ncbi:TIGR02099 family protein [Lysobacter sp. S4-A87]|uniref:YhdP family protein n=1 Tax=Lysobacter sp. S4-A87 TaxID=2925843 RepID=UPI001F536245|nr:YhdP family protein [Lysobacter sp. S4-A87]UNK49378.1 TIGR02099 family protein [Lysobacter sp. S4-A87]
MPTPMRRRLRIARRGLVYTTALVLVLIALVLAIASQLLPLAESNPKRVAAWLSERAGRPVSFDKVETDWTRRGPLLRLDNLRVGAGDEAFTVGDTEMLVSVYAGLLPGHAFSELRLRGLDLTLERSDDARWKVRGLPGQEQAARDPLSALEGLGELQVIGGKLTIMAPQLGIDARIPRIDLRLRVDGPRVRAGVRAWPSVGVPGAAMSPLDAVFDFDRKQGDGRAYLGTRRADLAAWGPLLQLAGVGSESGQGRAEAWAQLRGHRITEVIVDAALDRVGLRGAALANGSVPRVLFPHIETRARWRLVDGGWRADAPRLRIDSAGHAQKLDGLAIAGGTRYAIVADRIDAGPLLAAAALSDRLEPGLRQWLYSTAPQVSLQRIEVAGVRGGPMRTHARIAAFGFKPAGNAPGLSGLAGEFDGDADGFSLVLDPKSPMVFDWPRGFGVAQTVALQGLVSGWREGAGWRVGTPALAIKGNGFGVQARGGLWWQGDGSRPWIDIAADIDETQVPVAKGFWIHHKMAPRVIEWLDSALQGGRLRNGHAVVSGDLDDWPFRDRNGRFEAVAQLEDAVVKFQPGWPAAEGLDADVAFIADGFTVEGHGRLAGVAIDQIRAGIDHYGGGALTVKAQGGADAAQLLALLRDSPLQHDHADTLNNVVAGGAARVGFDMNMPLVRGAVTDIGGTVELKDAKLADPRWKLAFDQVNGRAEYARGGFGAKDLRVRHDGQPGRLTLLAGDQYVSDKTHVFEADLDADMAIADLLDRAPEMAWLKPHVDGRSRWTVGIGIAKAAKGRAAPTMLQLRSDLVGTSLNLPAPLRKPAGDALAASIDAPLPMGSDDIRVTLGDLVSVRARSRDDAAGKSQTGVRIALGGARVDEAPPAHGLVATGRAPVLDAIDWVAMMYGGSGGGLALQRIDVTAQRLNLVGGAFADTRLIVVPAAQGATAVQVDGAALRGAVLIPAGEGAAIAGRFDRVYWRAPKAPAAATGAATPAPASPVPPAPAATAGNDGFNPARIPPLNIDIADLRMVDARLGEANLRTRPSSNGMRFEQLRMRSPGQNLDVSGDWSGRGAAARTQMDVKIDSKDLGALLGGFGMSQQLAGGIGTMHFAAGWNGSPADFNLATLEGSLDADLRDGRLLEVEPGAGRVLGLLSLAQLPRRLMLDFRDFFSKGFAFNHAGGKVRFSAGTAHSDAISIDGPAAQISISGSANLRAQSFDQTIEVRPKAGNLLTVAGAIAAGPVGAAIGAAANAVLQKPLGQMASRTYRVTGPWKEPKVEVVGSEQGRAQTTVPPSR